MKKILTLTFIACILLCGYAFADVGIPSVPETQGIVTSTSLNAVGNFASATEIQWRSTNAPQGLSGIPPLGIFAFGSGIYESTYTEDTQSHGVGLMLYDKELDVETSDQITGQWNIEATKQIAFVGIDGAHVVSSDAIMVDGASTSYYTPSAVVCPFAADETLWTPYYCNRAEAGSTIDMTVANARTTTTDRFVMSIGPQPNPAAGSGNVELNHDIRVTELVADVPSSGLALAYMDVLVQEARGFADIDPFPEPAPFETLMERIEFSEETCADGAVTLFEKLMHYESGIVR